MTRNGWIKIHRKVLDSEIYRSGPKAFKLWIHLLFRANVQDNTFWHEKLQREVLVRRGETIFSLRGLWDELNTYHDKNGRLRTAPKESEITFQNIRTLLRQFEGRGEISLISTQPVTHIKITNYSLYQDKSTQEVTQQVTQSSHKPNTDIRIEERTKIFITTEELQNIANVKGVALEEVEKMYEKLKDWCLSKGKTYKDYRAALRNWVQAAIDKGEIKPKKEFKPVIYT